MTYYGLHMNTRTHILSHTRIFLHHGLGCLSFLFGHYLKMFLSSWLVQSLFVEHAYGLGWLGLVLARSVCVFYYDVPMKLLEIQ